MLFFVSCRNRSQAIFEDILDGLQSNQNRESGRLGAVTGYRLPVTGDAEAGVALFFQLVIM